MHGEVLGQDRVGQLRGQRQQRAPLPPEPDDVVTPAGKPRCPHLLFLSICCISYGATVRPGGGFLSWHTPTY